MPKHRFLFAITIWTWILASALAVLFFFVMRSDLSGIEWLASPLFGMALLSVMMTVFYLVARNKPIQSTVIVMAWLFLLFVATTINMLTLAHLVLGNWEDFQAMPVMGTLQLILVAAGVHLSLKDRRRRALYVLLIWTIVLFLFTTSTMISLAFAFFGGWEAWQTYPTLGVGVWTGLVMAVYLAMKAPSISTLDALLYWAWSVCIGVSVSMLGVFYNLLNGERLWPFYPIVGAFGFALLITALRISTQHHQEGG